MPTSRWVCDVVSGATEALAPLADPQRAAGAFAYMKGVAPFLGVSAPQRRRALRMAWAPLPPPTSEELGSAAQALMHLREREYHYAAYDLVDRYVTRADADFLHRFGTSLLTTTPWWDTVDGFVNAMVSPLMRAWHTDAIVDEWSESTDRWLIRAAIGHQRGWKSDTNIPRALALCDEHWHQREFFIAKAIGWSLRDLARIDAAAVRTFLAQHDDSNRVAIREAERGLG